MGQIFSACAYGIENRTCYVIDTDKFYINCYFYSATVLSMHYLRWQTYHIMWGGQYILIVDKLDSYPSVMANHTMQPTTTQNRIPINISSYKYLYKLPSNGGVTERWGGDYVSVTTFANPVANRTQYAGTLPYCGKTQTNGDTFANHVANRTQSAGTLPYFGKTQTNGDTFANLVASPTQTGCLLPLKGQGADRNGTTCTFVGREETKKKIYQNIVLTIKNV